MSAGTQVWMYLLRVILPWRQYFRLQIPVVTVSLLIVIIYSNSSTLCYFQVQSVNAVDAPGTPSLWAPSHDLIVD